MQIVQEIGSYAGLAAVLGLAILSALYFSQARDVKRLREWAGRAPERAPEPARVVAASQPPRPAQPATPAGGKPATAAAGQPATAAAGAQVKPAQAAAAGAATPAAAQGAGAATGAGKAGAAAGGAQAGAGAGTQTAATGGGAGTPQGESATPAAASAAGAAKAKEAGDDATDQAAAPPTEATPGANGASVDTGEQATATGPATAAGAATQPPTVPPRAPIRRPPLRQPGQPTRPRSQILPSYEEVQSPTPWYRRLLASPRYLVLALVAVLVLGGGIAFGLTQLGSSDDGGSKGGGAPKAQTPSNGTDGGTSPSGSKAKSAAVNPSRVTVAVLNGTSVPGLAAQIGDKLKAGKFKLGNVSNSNDGGTRAESVVFFARGNEREARAVSKRLRVAQREPIDAQTQQLAGDASVVVIAGADQTR